MVNKIETNNCNMFKNWVKGMLIFLGIMYLIIAIIFLGLSIFDSLRIKYNMINMTIIADEMKDTTIDDNLDKINKKACKLFIKNGGDPLSVGNPFKKNVEETVILCYLSNKDKSE